MKKILFILVFALLFAGCSSNTDIENIAMNGEVKWIFSLVEAQKLSEFEGKPIMIDFYADWCVWCKKLDQDVYSRNDVSEISKKFICAKINTDENQNEAVKYGVRGLPTIIFLDSKGNIVQQIVGYRDGEYFMQVMRGILNA